MSPQLTLVYQFVPGSVELIEIDPNQRQSFFSFIIKKNNKLFALNSETCSFRLTESKEVLIRENKQEVQVLNLQQQLDKLIFNNFIEYQMKQYVAMEDLDFNAKKDRLYVKIAGIDSVFDVYHFCDESTESNWDFDSAGIIFLMTMKEILHGLVTSCCKFTSLISSPKYINNLVPMNLCDHFTILKQHELFSLHQPVPKIILKSSQNDKIVFHDFLNQDQTKQISYQPNEICVQYIQDALYHKVYRIANGSFIVIGAVRQSEVEQINNSRPDYMKIYNTIFLLNPKRMKIKNSALQIFLTNADTKEPDVSFHDFVIPKDHFEILFGHIFHH